MPGGSFGLLDWAVIIAYLLAMVGIGAYFTGRQKSARTFFLAEGRLGSMLVGLSILGTYLSALTMIALPGKSFSGEDMLWSVQLPFLLLTAFVITRFVLPWYRRAGVVSVYQFLEQRIHVSARMLASVAFLALAAGRMGLTLWLPAMAFCRIANADINTVIIIMGLVTIAYTVMGGIEAVIWTDVIQVVIFVVGALLSIAFVLWDTHAQGGGFVSTAAQYHKFRFWEPSLDITRIATLWLVLQTIFETIRIYGTQQDMTQRYMTTRSTREANRSVWISIVGYIPLGFIFYFIGAALFVYYQMAPDPTVRDAFAAGTLKADEAYPHFIATRLPIGIRGLVLAAIFAAAMSTISSIMNSCSTVCTEDFYRRFWPKDRPDRHYLRMARALTLVWGAIAIGVAMFFAAKGQSAQDMWSKTMSFSTTGVLALMALAFLPIRVRPLPAILGFAAAAVTVFGLAYATTVHFLLYPVIGNTVGFVVAFLVNTIVAWAKGRSLNDPAERFPLEAASVEQAESAPAEPDAPA
jgi:solute:Na+ symporter, SSS family